MGTFFSIISTILENCLKAELEGKKHNRHIPTCQLHGLVDYYCVVTVMTQSLRT